MILTNTQDLPQPIVNAIIAKERHYEESHTEDYDISVTSLISPPQLVELARRYDDQLVEDASDRIYALMGQIIHFILELGAEPGDEIEERYNAEIGGWIVSGQIDRYIPSEGILQDWKLMSVWEMIFGLKEEKIAQVNILAYLRYRATGEWPEKLQIVPLFRDWQKSKASRESNYPLKQGTVVDVEMWSIEEIEAMLVERINDHRDARDGYIRPCTDDERWYTGTKYAVMKKGRKSAVKLFDESNGGHKAAFGMAEGDKAMWVEKRPGLSKRCADYCPVGKAGLCPQWEAEKEEA